MTPTQPIQIIGGGLAGLSLGLGLARAGVPVTLFETGAYPRHRVCGEFITGLPQSTRERLGLDPLLAGAVQNRQVAWFHDGTSPPRLQTLPAPAPSLSRHALDARLAGGFLAAGGKLLTQTRHPAVGDAPGRVFANGRRRARSDWLGLKIHARALPLAADLELHLGDQAYVGLAAIEDGRVNICGLFRRRKLCAKGPDLILAYLQAAGLASLAARLARAPLDPASFCAVAALAFDARTLPAAAGVQLGDACAMIPPFTGHGMAMAFQSAEVALDPLLAYARGEVAWPATTLRIRAALRRRFRLRLATAAVLHPFLLQPARQRWFARLNRRGLLPLRSFYAVLH